MTEFITVVIATTVKYVETHPNHVHEVSEILKPVMHKTLTQDMFCVGKQSILQKIKGLSSSAVTVQWTQAQF
jgi:hypothetical protein